LRCRRAASDEYLFWRRRGRTSHTGQASRRGTCHRLEWPDHVPWVCGQIIQDRAAPELSPCRLVPPGAEADESRPCTGEASNDPFAPGRRFRGVVAGRRSVLTSCRRAEAWNFTFLWSPPWPDAMLAIRPFCGYEDNPSGGNRRSCSERVGDLAGRNCFEGHLSWAVRPPNRTCFGKVRREGGDSGSLPEAGGTFG